METSPRLVDEFLTLNDALRIQDQDERVVALRLIAAGCLVRSQVQVGNSVIDFLVINPKNPSSEGTLVEVTRMLKGDQVKKTITRRRKGKKVRLKKKTGMRKARQIESMKASGLKWTVLYGEFLKNIMADV